VFVSTTWTGPRAASSTGRARTEHALGAVLVGAVLLQLVLGAIQRHLAKGLFIHITFAVVVLVLAVLVGSRLWGLYEEQPLLQRIGKALMGVAVVQVMLGFTAFLAVLSRSPNAARTASEVLLTTAHQGGGSVLLGCAMMAALWSRRLLVTASGADKGGT